MAYERGGRYFSFFDLICCCCCVVDCGCSTGNCCSILAIVEFALCHFVVRGSMVRYVIEFLGHDVARSVMARFFGQYWGRLSASLRFLVHLPEVRPVNRSLRPGGRSRIAARFRNGRPRGDRYAQRDYENRDEGHEDRVRFRCHVPLLGSDSEVGLYRQVEETSVMPVTLWSYRRKL